MNEWILKREIESTGETLKHLELETRAELDRLKLEIAALRLFVEWANPNTTKVCHEIRGKVFLGINPEKEDSCF